MKRLVPVLVLLCAAGYPTAAGVLAQNKPAASGPLAGAVDIHVHSYPDSQGRSIDSLEAVRQAKAAGMRAIVFKAHYDSTAPVAYIIRKVVPGIEVYGGIALNHSIGGVNVAAVERLGLAAQKFGGAGRMVHMPTTEDEHQLRFAKQDRPSVSIAKGGQLLPEARNVIASIAKNNLSIATGHSSPAESLLVIQEARKQGITGRIVVTHPMNPAMSMSMAQMQQAAKMGSFLEITARSVFQKLVPVSVYIDAIKKIGAASFIMSSDLGQENSPLPVKGLTEFVSLLRSQGISEADINIMLRVNPARFLGLPPAK